MKKLVLIAAIMFGLGISLGFVSHNERPKCHAPMSFEYCAQLNWK
jgi:hypothetical protein